MKMIYHRYENKSNRNILSSIKQEQLTNDTCCQAAAGPKRNDCVRYTNYLRAQAESKVYSLLGTVPIANKSMLRCGAFGKSQATYYRNLNGQRGLNPQEQQLILQAVAQAGGDPTTGFDRYQEQQVFFTGQ